MRLKQLQVIKDQHKRYREKLEALQTMPEPSAQCHIVHALVRGETVPLLNPAEISNAAREAVASCTYGNSRNLGFEKVFRAPASYTKSKRDYDTACKSSAMAVSRYGKEADALLLKAELNQESDPDEVSSELRIIAIKHGIDA